MRVPRISRQRVGVAGAAGLMLASLIVAAGAAAYPTRLVPSARFMFPDWLSGPFAGLGTQMHLLAFAVALTVMIVLYVVTLTHARDVPVRWVIGTVAGLHAVFLLAPPLLSTDIFGYLAHARLWS
ncbi:MAG: hypothetical protein M3515_04435, partial [Actinomycetota bacterium]|nr:hypothetical protein [Actinomycetota bacterium]